MRAIPTQAAAVIATDNRADHVRVDIDITGAGGWQDMGAYLGVDWIRSLSWGVQEDQPGQVATVNLRRRYNLISLSPLMTGSIASGALAVGRGIRIYAAVEPMNTTYEAVTSWELFFDGTIDSLDWGGENIQINARDAIGVIMDTWLKVEGWYPSIADLRATSGDSGNWSVVSGTVSANNDTSEYWHPSACTRIDTTGAAAIKRTILTPLTTGQTYRFRCRVKRNSGTGDITFGLQSSGGGAISSQNYNPSSGDDWIEIGGRDAQIDFSTATAGNVELTITTSGTESIWIDDITIIDVTNNAALPDLEDAIQEILDFWLDSPPTLDVPSSPGFKMQEWAQDPMSVYDAIRRIADLIGYDLRYVWDGASAFELRLYEPERSAPSVDHTFSTEDYYESGISASQRIDDVRNFVRVVWYEEPVEGVYVRRWYDAVDASSVSVYGERFMQITEGSTSSIDSAAEAQALAEAALEDLKTARFEFSVPAKFFPWAELQDYYTFAANGVHFDTDQDLSVLGYSHTANEDGQLRTELVCAGLPRVGQRHYLSREARPGSAPFSPFATATYPTSSGAGTAPDVTNKAGGIMFVEYIWPEWPWYDRTEVHVSASSGFIPSSSTLVSTGRNSTQLVDTSALSGTYYVKVRHLDKAGNATTSRQSSISI